MSFTQSQVRKLRSKLNPRHIKTREADGVSLSYLEGWHVVAEANRIFGFDGWDRETVSSDCVWTKQLDGRYCAAYAARIRIRVRAGGAVIVREGSGAGESKAASPGQAHEFAAKAAETDATKRALMTFGNAFGLSLYGGATDAKARALPAPAATEVTAMPVSEEGGSSGAETGEVDPKPDASNPTAPQCVLPTGEANKASLPVTLPVPGSPQISPLDEAKRMNDLRQKRIDKSELVLSEPRRIRNSGHLAFVASKPCLICGRNRAHAHHLKFAQPTALGRKVSDEFTVPLCSIHHRELHQHGDERVWWAAHRIDVLATAAGLWSQSTGAVSENRSDDRSDSPKRNGET